MIYWFTGQPGHGKTLNAIEKLLEFKAKGRIVYACNVRKFDYHATGVLEMTPEQFKDWPNFLPDGAVALVDEAYEHGMLPKRPPGSQVPHHVEQLAKHRHRGLDFIFVSQSPDKQCDQFVQDLIEEHVHVRRMFGSNTVQLRIFDKYQSQAEKAPPIRTKLIPLLRGKKAVGTYESTEMDTMQRRVPWYYWAMILGIPLALGLFYYVFGGIRERLGGGDKAPASAQTTGAASASSGEGNGASATVAEAAATMTTEQYVASFQPRIPSQPWSAPVYDGKLNLSSEPPRIFCMASAPGYVNDGAYRENSTCTCLTEQGTRYQLEQAVCVQVARVGQYEPYYAERGDQRHVDGHAQIDMIRNDIETRRVTESVSGNAGSVGVPQVDSTFGTLTRPTP